MTDLVFLQDWEDAAIGVAFWVCLLWPLGVRFFWPWQRDAWGWNMVLKTEMIAVALLPAILRVEFGVQPGLGLLWVAVVAVTLIPLVILWRTWIIYKAQRSGADAAAAEKAAAAGTCADK